MIQQVLGLTSSHLFLLWFVGTAAAGVHIKEPNLKGWALIVLFFFCVPVSGITSGVLSYRKGTGALRIIWDVLWGTWLPVWLSGVFEMIIRNCKPMVAVLENGVVDFYANATSKKWTWMVLVTRNQFANVDRHGIPEPVRVTLALRASAHLVTALAMYGVGHDPSQTFKPSWTDVLG